MSLQTFKEFLLNEVAPDQPAVHDIVKGIMNRPNERDNNNKPTTKRSGQRAARRLKANGWKGDRNNSMGYPSEEEEANMPAIRDREMISNGMRDRTPTERGGVTNAKRNAQMAGRKQRMMHGKGTGGRNYLDNLFGKGGRYEEYEEEPLTPGQQIDKDEHTKEIKRMYKQIFQSGSNRANPWAKSVKNSEEEETKTPADTERMKRFDNQVAELGDKNYKDILHSEPNMKRMKQRFARNRRKTWGDSR